MEQAAAWPLFVLAADHRVTLRNMYGLPERLGAADRERLEDVKHLTLDALIDAGSKLPAGVPGILIDEEFGADAAHRAKHLGICVAMPVEKSVQPVFELEYGDDFEAHISLFDPDYVKSLVMYNPEGDAATNELQRQRMLALDEILRRDGRAHMLEVLVPALPAQLAVVGGSQRRFDDEMRPALVGRAVSELRAAGIAPALWKLEGAPDRAGAEQVMEAIRGDGGSARGCLILGRGEDEDKVIGWLEVASAVDGFVGFAVGRTIWARPIDGYLNNRLSRKDAIAAIRDAYLRLVNVYLDGQTQPDGRVATAPAS